MAKKSRKKQNKERLHRIKQSERKIQIANREKFLNGETIKIKMTAKMPTANEYQKVFDKEVIDEKIKKLNSLDLKVVNDAEIISAVNDVISFEPKPSIRITSMISSIRKTKNSYLYRVRPCNSNCLKTMAKFSDAWNPPADVINQKGRLNSENESLLYVAENMETAIKEMKIKEDNCFWLVVYNINKEISAVNIGGLVQEDNEYAIIHKKVADFLRSEFTREVKKGEEYEYRVSNMIARYYYDTSNVDGWFYPSVADVGQYCLCLNPIKAKEKMSLAFVIHSEIIEGEIKCDYVAFLNENGEFEYETINEALKRDTDLQKFLER